MDIDKMRDAGIEYETALRRLCGNEALYHKFLKKFIEDESLKDLKKAMNSRDEETAFRNAHTLKGLCLNLGLQCLGDAYGEVCKKFRETGTIDPEDVERIAALHGEVVKVIGEEVE